MLKSWRSRISIHLSQINVGLLSEFLNWFDNDLTANNNLYTFKFSELKLCIPILSHSNTTNQLFFFSTCDQVLLYINKVFDTCPKHWMNEAPHYNFVWSFTCDLFHYNSVSKTAQFLLTQVIVHCLPTLLTISSNRLSSPSQGSIYLCIQWEWSGRRFNYFIVIHIT